MFVETRHFGRLEIEDDKVITFEEGLPGFEKCKRFVLLKDEKDIDTEAEGLFWYLQSLDDPEASFVMMDVLMVMPGYNPMIEADEIASLGEYSPETFFVYNIVVIPENIMNLSVNLKAPIVINEKEKKGKQIIVSNEDYAIRYHIFEELKKMK